MKFIVYILAIITVLIVSFALYVRLAPSDVARWHRPVPASADADMAGGAIRVVPAGPDALARADAALRALPRTQVLAGSVEQGRITYVTRSRLWGFPDYTTLEQGDGVLKLFARLRFGGSDLGVNAARLARVLAAIEG